ncbi:hypothetical protein [Thermonema rossianum]|uniref:hypothetical protein n=1 Tax=Thermonema rossianum TaxID=55505 RepID=UPI0005718D69|nr:hypothetical protein [Thermonema rossianum]
MLNLQKIVLSVTVLALLPLFAAAQEVALYRGTQKLTPSRSLLAQEVFEEDELRLVIALDEAFMKAHPDIQTIRPFKTLITHQRKDGKMQTMVLTGKDRFTLAPFHPVEGERFVIEITEWMVTYTDGSLKKEQVQDRLIKLIY